MKEKTPKSLDNSLTTADAVKLTGLSRKTLSNYIDRGICSPKRESDNLNADLHWSFEQIFSIDRARMLRETGMSMVESSALAKEGNDAVEQAIYEQYVALARTARRLLKASVSSRSERSDTLCAGRQKGLYLRYIPLRWMALAPAPHDTLILPGTAEHMRLYTGLDGVAQVAGWCTYRSTGTITSLRLDESGLSSYAYAYLASPPMPYVSGRLVIDGGCYHVFEPDNPACACEYSDRCLECARFGRAPTSEEQFRWNVARRTREGLWDNTVMLGEMREPYETGFWANLTKSDAESRHNVAPKPQPTGSGHMLNDNNGVTVRPRLMPHAVRLPLGVTACVIPSGVYLCIQSDENDQMQAFNQLLGAARVLEQVPMTKKRERELSAALEDSFTKFSRDSGPFLEPFAQPSTHGIPQMKGWFRETTPTDIRNLKLPVNMALQPEDGFLVIGDAMPQAFPDDSPRYEFQILVDANSILTS